MLRRDAEVGVVFEYRVGGLLVSIGRKGGVRLWAASRWPLAETRQSREGASCLPTYVVGPSRKKYTKPLLKCFSG